MNIRQLSTGTRPLLTIDDPSIYQIASETYSEFLKVATATEIASVSTPVSDTLYLIGTDSAHYVPYVYCTDDQWRIMPNPFGRGPTLPYPTIHGDSAIYQLNDNLVAIDNHLYALRKELSYWNLYQISYSVDKTDDFSTILSSLAPGEALIINFDGLLSYGGIEYKRGDVIIRLSNGEYVTIEGSVAGFYYPAAISRAASEKTYTLEYKYHQGIAPNPETATEITSVPLEDPSWTETFTITGGVASESFVYGIKEEIAAAASVATIHFDIAKWGSGTEQTNIPPVIKIFNVNGEEIWTDFTCSATEQATQYTLNISSLPTGIIKYVYIK